MSKLVSDQKIISDPLVLFLHGYCEAGWIWDEVIKNLGNQYFCQAPDLPGFGKNSLLPEKISVEAVAESIWKYLDEQHISKVILIGHSLGGYVALAMAELRSNAVRGLALVHSTPFADSEEKKENRNKVIRFVGENGSRLFLDQFAPGLFHVQSAVKALLFRKRIDDTSPGAIIYYAQAMRDRPDRSHVIKKSFFPVMAICGKFDQIISADICSQIAGLGAQIETHQLEHSAHAGMLEEPLKTAEIIQRFLKKCIE